MSTSLDRIASGATCGWRLSAEEPDALMRARPGLWEPWRVTARATRPDARKSRPRSAADSEKWVLFWRVRKRVRDYGNAAAAPLDRTLVALTAAESAAKATFAPAVTFGTAKARNIADTNGSLLDNRRRWEQLWAPRMTEGAQLASCLHRKEEHRCKRPWAEAVAAARPPQTKAPQIAANRGNTAEASPRSPGLRFPLAAKSSSGPLWPTNRRIAAFLLVYKVDRHTAEELELRPGNRHPLQPTATGFANQQPTQ